MWLCPFAASVRFLRCRQMFPRPLASRRYLRRFLYLSAPAAPSAARADSHSQIQDSDKPPSAAHSSDLPTSPPLPMPDMPEVPSPLRMPQQAASISSPSCHLPLISCLPRTPHPTVYPAPILSSKTTCGNHTRNGAPHFAAQRNSFSSCIFSRMKIERSMKRCAIRVLTSTPFEVSRKSTLNPYQHMNAE